jgi:hypothetical protein
VVILTECTHEEILAVSDFCRVKGIKVIVADAYSVFTRVFTDFGDTFQVLDKNGEEMQDVMIKHINVATGEIELLPSNKHKLEDGDELTLLQLEGPLGLALNGKVFKVKEVKTPYAFVVEGLTE